MLGFYLLIVQQGVQDPCWDGAVTSHIVSAAETAAKITCKKWCAVAGPSYLEFFLQFLLSMLGHIETGRVPGLRDDLIQPVGIHLRRMRIHPSSGQTAQSALSRPGEI